MPDKKKTLEWALRFILGITFIGASIHKIQNPEAFAEIIYGYYIFPGFMINLSAIVVPFLELFAGIALIIGIYRQGALIVINGFLMVFIAIIGFNLIRGHQFDCGCFSVAEPEHVSSAVWLLVRDAALLWAGIMLWSRTFAERGFRGNPS